MFKREINIQIFKPVPSNQKPALASSDFRVPSRARQAVAGVRNQMEPGCSRGLRRAPTKSSEVSKPLNNTQSLTFLFFF